jgi:hypothetical protein
MPAGSSRTPATAAGAAPHPLRAPGGCPRWPGPRAAAQQGTAPRRRHRARSRDRQLTGLSREPAAQRSICTGWTILQGRCRTLAGPAHTNTRAAGRLWCRRPHHSTGRHRRVQGCRAIDTVLCAELLCVHLNVLPCRPHCPTCQSCQTCSRAAAKPAARSRRMSERQRRAAAPSAAATGTAAAAAAVRGQGHSRQGHLSCFCRGTCSSSVSNNTTALQLAQSRVPGRAACC